MICPVCASSNPGGSAVCRTCGAPLSVQAATPNSHTLPVGTKLQQGKYTVGKVLGQGGFGITYKGGDPALGRVVAIKELFLEDCVRHGTQVMVPTHARLSAAALGRAKQRFVKEARTVAQFNHTGIVAIYTAFEENNTAYIVMEYLQGRTLAQVLEANGGPLREQEAVRHVRAMGPALKEIHQRGVLHRDLTPTNVVSTDDGRTVVVDFGAAREFTAGMTGSFDVFLNPGFAPLEQYSSRARPGVYTDVYALGATLYHLLTGKVPVPAPDRVNRRPLQEPRLLNAQISHRVSGAVMRAMAIRASDRYQSAGDFLDSLTP